MKRRKQLILHIGRHKTGTSSLQNHFSKNVSALADKGILYPLAGRVTPSGTVDTAHHNFSHTLRYKPKKEIETLNKALTEEAEDFDKILLSSEDFQNLKDFDLFKSIFADYDITVVGYLREGLGYNLSGFAQRIHFSEEIFNLRQYIERQNIRVAAFVENWKRVSEASIFRLYERDKLKNRDIVDDFFDAIGIKGAIGKKVDVDSNPSLSGNLLSFKMLLNLTGQSALVPYSALEKAASLDKTFSGKIHVNDRVAEELRGLSKYNAILKTMFPDMAEPSFETAPKLFDFTRWDNDMALIATIPELALAQTLSLGAFGKVLENHGIQSDLTSADFPVQKTIDDIQIPASSLLNSIKERTAASLLDATVARKAKAKAESEVVRLQADNAALKADFKTVSKKLAAIQKDRKIVIEDRDGKITHLQGMKSKLTETLQLRTKELKELRAERSAKLKARDEVILRLQGEKAKEAAATKQLLNNLEELREELAYAQLNHGNGKRP